MTALRRPGTLPSNELAALEAWIGTFWPFQREWLLDPSKFAVCVKCRQCGFSHTTAGCAVLWAAIFGETTTVISVGEREAIEVIEKAHKHSQLLEGLGSTWARCKRKGDGLVFENGGRVLALPASSGGRGFSGNIFLDEFAYIENPQRVWDSAAAVALHGYRMRVASTPNGVGNAFHSLWTNDHQNKGWAKHEVSLARALADGMTVDVDDCWKMAKGDPRVFAQLFECSFLDGAEQYIPTKLILEAVSDNTRLEPGMGVTYAGYDVGLTNDLSVLLILQQSADNRVWVQKVIVGKRTNWEEQQQVIFQAFRDYNISRLCVDSTGVGHGLVQALQKKLGTQKIEPVIFTMLSKEELATDMYQAFGDSMIKIPDDKDLIKDVGSIRRLITTAGNVRYDAQHTADGHADRAWALALAIHACTNKPGRRVMKGPGDFGNT